MRLITHLIFGCAILLSGCATTSRSPRSSPQPGYRCNFELRGSFGVISSDFEIPVTGEGYGAYIRWDAGDGSFANPWITGAWFKQSSGHFSLDYGYVSIMRHIWEQRPGRRPRPLTLSLELSPTIAPIMRASRLSSDFQQSGGPFHIQLNWSVVAALARGSPNLYLIARNRRFEMIDQVEVNRDVFVRAEPHLIAAFDSVERMITNPADHCLRVEDLRDDDIVVT